MSYTPKKRIVIVGGGFAGVKCALELARSGRKDIRIRLVSDRSNFEYHGALYRLVAGGSPMEVCLPLRDIFGNLEVDVVTDKAITVDHANNMVVGQSGSTYGYDYLILGLGAETNYFGIPGLEENSLGMKTISDALELKHHITETLQLCPTKPLAERERALHFVIVGAGPTGVELAGELAGYIRHLVRGHGLDPERVTIDLVERADRVLPKLREELSGIVQDRLTELGVTVRTETSIESFDGTTVVLSGQEVSSPTVVWTAGVKANRLTEQIGNERDRMGRVVVDDYLRVQGTENIFAGGDCAATKFSGMAPTAIADGQYIARTIIKLLDEKALGARSASEPAYSIPVGPGWAGTQWGGRVYQGTMGWMLRRWIDWKVFRSFLSFKQSWAAFRSHYQQSEHTHPKEVC